MMRRFIGLCILYGLFAAMPALAQEPIAPIAPPPQLETKVRFVSYNGDLDGVGIINLINEQRIVLSDFGYYFAPGVEFYTYNGTLTYRDYFKPGMAAGFYMDDAQERIESVWEVKIKED